MSEFLIKIIDANHSDSVKDKAGCYKRGDVVQVYKNGRCTEPPSPSSKMCIIKVLEMSVEEGKIYTESKEEAQETTREWNQLRWNKAVQDDNFDEFLSKPTVENTINTEISITVSLETWHKMQFSSNYYPFVSKPTAKDVLASSSQLTGTVRTVTLRGNIMVVITRRKYSFGIDNIPEEIKNKLQAKKIVTLSKLQAETVLKEKI